MKKIEQELSKRLHTTLGIEPAGTVEPGHTPRPWHVEKHSKPVWMDSGGPGNVSYAQVVPITLVVHEQLGDPRLRTCVCQLDASTEAESNARLIAAAPDLLEACRDLVQAWKDAPMDLGRRTDRFDAMNCQDTEGVPNAFFSPSQHIQERSLPGRRTPDNLYIVLRVYSTRPTSRYTSGRVA